MLRVNFRHKPWFCEAVGALTCLYLPHKPLIYYKDFNCDLKMALSDADVQKQVQFTSISYDAVLQHNYSQIVLLYSLSSSVDIHIGLHASRQTATMCIGS